MTAHIMLSDPVIAQIAESLTDNLNKWYGPTARLSESAPTFYNPNHSFQFRFQVVVGADALTGIRVKIRRHPSHTNLQQALAVDTFRQQAHSEYASLVAMAAAIDPRSTTLCAVRPLAYLASLNAVVTEELAARPFKKILLRPSTIINTERLQLALQRAGLWLRTFHQLNRSIIPEPFPNAALQLEINQLLDGLATLRTQPAPIEELRSAFKEQLSAIDQQLVPTANYHGDFQLGNLLITDDNRVAAVDADWSERWPIYEDLATLITDPVTRGIQILTGGLFLGPTRLEQFRASILSGYFDNQKVEAAIMNLYCAVAVLRKWRLDETLLASASGWRRLAAPRVVGRLRKYLLQNIWRYLRSSNPPMSALPSLNVHSLMPQSPVDQRPTERV